MSQKGVCPDLRKIRWKPHKPCKPPKPFEIKTILVLYLGLHSNSEC